MECFINKYLPTKMEDFYFEKTFLSFISTLISYNDLNLILIGRPDIGKSVFLNVIVKKYFNCENFEKNIMYINNSKEQGIHYYRTEVKNFCKNSSLIPNKKKVVLIDDLDLLNDQSQQVFRNCIDNYSSKVHFICACTNVNKIIESLQSRLLLLKIPESNILNNIYLKIKEQENIDIDPNVQEFFIKMCQNSTKMCINYLEKFKLYDKKITKDNIISLCTSINYNYFENYLLFLKEKKLSEAIEILFNIFDMGYSVLDILDCFYNFLKLTNSVDDDVKYNIIKVICKYIYIFYSLHEDEIELSLFTNNLLEYV